MAKIWDNNVEYIRKLPVFGLEYLAKNGEDKHNEYLDPLIGWSNSDEYLKCLDELAKLFIKNFETYVRNGKDEEQINDLTNIRNKGGPQLNQN